MRIVKCSPYDIPMILNIRQASSRNYVAITDGVYKSTLTSADLKNQFDSGVEFYFAIVGGEIKAYAGYDLKGKAATVRGLYVLPSSQRQGVGKSLLDFLELKAKTDGAEQLMLLAIKSAYWAVRFYLKQGYQPIVRDKQYIIRTNWPLLADSMQILLSKDMVVLFTRWFNQTTYVEHKDYTHA